MTMPDTQAAPRPGRMFERFPFLPALLILVVLLILNGVFEPNSLSFRSLTGLLSTYLGLVLLTVGQTHVVYAADIDLSVGAILSLVNVSIIVLMQAMGGTPLAALVACAAGVAIGLICGIFNGLVVAGLRLQPIVATFATSIVFSGIALFVLPVAGTPAPRAYWRTYGGRVFEIPFVVLLAVVLAVLLVVVARTRLVTQLLAVGDGQQAAYQSGLPVTAIRIRGYALCGTFAALAALCITGDTASGDPLVGGAMTLNSVAALVLGGTALSGGIGSVTGSVFGALIIGLVNSLVFFVGTPSEWQNLVQGLTILLALMLGILISGRTRR